MEISRKCQKKLLPAVHAEKETQFSPWTNFRYSPSYAHKWLFNVLHWQRRQLVAY